MTTQWLCARSICAGSRSVCFDRMRREYELNHFVRDNSDWLK